jgi:hypothetical protein
MHPWKQALREGLFTGAVASILSTAALALAGRRENRESAAPVNAISHWFWGGPALRQDAPSWRYTATGYLVHHAASVFWATLHARALAAAPRERPPVTVAASAAAASAIACLVDFRLTPHRLTPGFQHRLSAPAMAAVYGCFALGLALGTSMQAARRVRPAPAGGRPGLPARRQPHRPGS